MSTRLQLRSHLFLCLPNIGNISTDCAVTFGWRPDRSRRWISFRSTAVRTYYFASGRYTWTSGSDQHFSSRSDGSHPHEIAGDVPTKPQVAQASRFLGRSPQVCAQRNHRHPLGVDVRSRKQSPLQTITIDAVVLGLHASIGPANSERSHGGRGTGLRAR